MTELKLDLIEARAIYRVLRYQYISYEDHEAHAAVNRICKFVEDNDGKVSDHRSGHGETGKQLYVSSTKG